MSVDCDHINNIKDPVISDSESEAFVLEHEGHALMNLFSPVPETCSKDDVSFEDLEPLSVISNNAAFKTGSVTSVLSGYQTSPSSRVIPTLSPLCDQTFAYAVPTNCALPHVQKSHEMLAIPDAEIGDSSKASVPFNDASSTAAFVRKVFFLVTIMLGLVAVMSAVPFIHPSLKTFFVEHFFFYYGSIPTFLVTYTFMVCCESVRRSFPANIIVTGILTLAMGYMCILVVLINYKIVLCISIGITVAVCTFFCAVSFFIKIDITKWQGRFVVVGLAMIAICFVLLICNRFFKTLWLEICYTIINSVILIGLFFYNIQLAFGKGQKTFVQKDCLFAALQIFNDITGIFFIFMTILSKLI